MIEGVNEGFKLSIDDGFVDGCFVGEIVGDGVGLGVAGVITPFVSVSYSPIAFISTFVPVDSLILSTLPFNPSVPGREALTAT